MQQLKLSIDLVPKPCWGKNLRKRMPRAEWERIRQQTFEMQGHRCAVCSACGQLNCHEVWNYDEQALVQHLTGFEAVCVPCHHVTHFGNSEKLAQAGHLDIKAVVAHFLAVNGVTRAEFLRHYREAKALWKRRSAMPWKTDLGAWASLVP